MPPLNFTLTPGRWAVVERTQTYRTTVWKQRTSVKGKKFKQRYHKTVTRTVKEKKFIPGEPIRVVRGYSGYMDHGKLNFKIEWMKVVLSEDVEDAKAEGDRWVQKMFKRMIKGKSWEPEEMMSQGAPFKSNASTRRTGYANLGKSSRKAVWNGVTQEDESDD